MKKSKYSVKDLINDWVILSRSKIKNKEISFLFEKSKELAQKCLDVFDELKANYSLPDEITDSIDNIQDTYFDLFIEWNDPSRKSVNNDINEDEKIQIGTLSSEILESGILESYDEYLPSKIMNLKTVICRL